MIFQLAYFSAVRPKLTDEDVRDILRSSTHNNRRCGLSGMLLLIDGVFFQVLEGEQAQVEETFVRISRDRRHSGLVRVVAEERAERSFPNWSMGFEKISHGDPAGEELPFDIADLSQNPAILSAGEKSPELLSFMRSLYAARNMRGAPGLNRPA
ncbi:BLUF domain protein [Parvibaculum lavamentivorans DS-1]|uniref:BLUF domain protein n=2 Tax=Parvibaculum lavamentivorans TaxID=256618 RepID=A7HQ46_PARL1|nr:BLUF domain protein [Parvibaculum lavamentivorans DS-1]